MEGEKKQLMVKKSVKGGNNSVCPAQSGEPYDSDGRIFGQSAQRRKTAQKYNLTEIPLSLCCGELIK